MSTVLAALPWVFATAAIVVITAAAIRFRKTCRVPFAAWGAFVALCFLALTAGWMNVVAEPAQAADESSFSTEMSQTIMLGDDICWAGRNASFDSADTVNDILASGYSVSVKDSKVAGSVRAAGYNVKVDNTTVKQSVTLAGYTVSMGGGSAKGVALAAAQATFTGETDSLYIAASKAYINGTVNGNAYVVADNLEIGPNAVIKGSLNVKADEAPSIADGASVRGASSIQLAPVEKRDDVAQEGSSLAVTALGTASSLLFNILACLVIAVLCEWLGRKRTADAVAMLKERTGALVGTGIIAALVAPVAIIILCSLVVTLPVAGALTLALIALTLVSGGFVAACLSKILFPNMGRFKAAMLGAVIIGAIITVPFLGGVVVMAAFMLTLGYVLQRIFLGLRKDTTPETPAAPESPAAAASDAPVPPAA